MCMYSLIHIRYHIDCMYGIMCIYGLIHRCYHIFRIYVVSYVNKIFTHTYDHRILRSSLWRNPIRIQCHISFLIWPSMALYHSYVLTVTSVNPTQTPSILYLWCHHIRTCLIQVVAIIPNNFNFPQHNPEKPSFPDGGPYLSYLFKISQAILTWPLLGSDLQTKSIPWFGPFHTT